MKLVALFFIIGISISYASNSYSQATTFSLKLKNKTVREFFEEIEKNSEYIFLYNSETLDSERVVSISVEKETISDVLDKLFKGTDNTYKVSDRQVYISKEEKMQQAVVTEARQQQGSITIRGKVIDMDKNPIPGVNIMIKGTLTGSVTDSDGSYSIVIPNKDVTLIFTFIGFETYETVVGEQREINVTLHEDAFLIEEVVVVGMGTMKKETLTGSVSAVKGDELTMPQRSLTNTIGGQITGIYTVQSRGEPGYDNSEFWIRGVSTFTGSRTPLVLIDGVPRNMADVAPEEVETFTVLKDAASTAIYGSEGANGVILITTKRGRVQKTSISYKGRMTISQPTRLPQYMGSVDFMNAYNELVKNDNDNAPAYYSKELIQHYASGIDRDVYPDVDWMSEMLENNTWNNDHNLTFRGGTDKYTFFVGASMYHETGLFKSTPLESFDNKMKYTRYNLRSNIDLDVTNTTKLSINLATQYSDKRRPYHGSDAIFEELSTSPPNLFASVFSNGRFSGNTAEQNRHNPYNMVVASGYQKYWTVKAQSDVVLEQKLDIILKGLKIRGQVSFDNNIDWSVNQSYTAEQYRINPSNPTGRLENESLDLILWKEEVKFGTPSYNTGSQQKNIYLESRLNYDRTFGNHDISVMANIYLKETQLAGSNAVPYRKHNTTLRGVYSFDRRYIIDASIGYTGSENFAKSNRYGFFPAASIGWNIANEPFFSSFDKYFSELKIRASVGLTGNDQVTGDRFLYRSTWSESSGNGTSIGIGGSGTLNSMNGIVEGRLGAPYLQWEEEVKRNLGLDLTMFDGQIRFIGEYFNNERGKILMQRKTVSDVAGFRVMPWQNYGKMKNYGFELDLELTRKFGEVDLSARSNYSFARNKVTEADEIPNPNWYYNSTGVSHNMNRIYIAERLYEERDFNITTDASGNRIYTLKEGYPIVSAGAPKPGDIMMKDLNEDGIINTFDMTYHAGQYPTIPEVMYGFGLTAEWKGFYGNIFFQGRGNMSVQINGVMRPFPNSPDRSSVRIEALDRWSQEKPSQDVIYPRLSASSSNNNYAQSSWWQRDGSYLRLKTLEFGYRFPKIVTENLKISGLTLFVQGMNLFVWDHIKIWDPDVSTGGYRYPISRTYTVGLQINI